MGQEESMIDYESARHFILWSKGHYEGKSLAEVIAEIVGSSNTDVDYMSKMYWMGETCKYYDIDGYSIIEQFLDFERRVMYERSTGYQQILDSMKVKLQMVKVWEEGSTIYALGKADLFDEDVVE